MITINIELRPTDIPEIATRMNARIHSAIGIGLFRIGQEMRNMGQRLAPYKTGMLRNSITAKPSRPIDKVTVGSGVKYAAMQNYGGIIRPKKSRWLTIPLPGVRGSIRSHEGFFIMSKRGNLIYAKKSGKGLKPLFVLKKQVRIKGTRFLSKAFDIQARGRAKQILLQEIMTALK